MTYDFAFWFNLVEAVIWFLIAAKSLQIAICKDTSLRKTFLILSVTMFLFGVSDIIELFTRAWYRPIGLFILKAGCVASIAYCFFIFFKNRAEFERVVNNRTS